MPGTINLTYDAQVCSEPSKCEEASDELILCLQTEQSVLRYSTGAAEPVEWNRLDTRAKLTMYLSLLLQARGVVAAYYSSNDDRGALVMYDYFVQGTPVTCTYLQNQKHAKSREEAARWFAGLLNIELVEP
ncbi:hypothetical protein S40285_10497 [Stachybotrys chlorohalonatus IBT 40285]|uniref:Uncharacterized protein n=1 Tax=Stachybotrys chlorohalonatus (strain IBT 40285) TaxID=1283841 RepID=A0A084QSB4_STAC4|nr:hypothetical protein S40285_10497 [Stachybotrys chlorohalonata IBT 40285]